jgi:hypothetical protein
MKSKNKLWYGEIPEIFKYGISCLGNSEKEVMETIKRQYRKLKDAYPDEETNFKTSFEYYGGYVYEVEIGKAYGGGLQD